MALQNVWYYATCGGMMQKPSTGIIAPSVGVMIGASYHLSCACRMSVLAILGPKCRVGRHVGDMSPNVGPALGDIAPFWAPTMLCHFCQLPTCRLHVHRN